MRQPITRTVLQALAQEINVALGTPTGWDTYTYYVGFSYGKAELVQLLPLGRIKNISPGGYLPHRELYQWMTGFHTGLTFTPNHQGA